MLPHYPPDTMCLRRPHVFGLPVEISPGGRSGDAVVPSRTVGVRLRLPGQLDAGSTPTELIVLLQHRVAW